MDSADPQPLDSISILIYQLSTPFVLSAFSPRLLCSALSLLKAFWGESSRLSEWVCERLSLLVVEHHVRQPDVFRGQPDLHHAVKLLWDPSQTVVLPLLRVSKDKKLSHSPTDCTVGRPVPPPGAAQREEEGVCHSASQWPAWPPGGIPEPLTPFLF